MSMMLTLSLRSQDPAISQGFWKVTDEGLESNENVANVRLSDTVSNNMNVFSKNCDIYEALLDVNWTALALWLWNSTVLTDFVDVTSDDLEVSDISIETRLLCHMLGKLGEDWNDRGSIVDAVEDIKLKNSNIRCVEAEGFKVFKLELISELIDKYG